MTTRAAGLLSGGWRDVSCNPASSATARDSDQDEEPAPCIEVPVVDDKCESWVATYDDPDSGSDRPWGGIAVSPQGDRIYQTGTSWTHPCEYNPVSSRCGDIVTVAYDADGQQLWKAHYAGAAGNHEQGEDIVVSPDGARVYVSGLQDWDFENDGGFAVIAYDAASGGEVWTARYDDAAGGWAVAWSVAVSPDGDEVYAAGRTEEQDFNQMDYATVAFDADTGAQLWDARYDGPGAVRESGTEVSQDWGADEVEVSSDGSQVYVTGASTGTSEGQSPDWMLDYATVAYRAAPAEEPGDPEPGTELWVARFDASDRDQPYGGMAVSPDGSRVVVTGLTVVRVVRSQTNPGLTASASTVEWATVAYEADTGAEVWVRRHGENGIAQDLAFSPKGDRVVVVGEVGSGFFAGGRFGVVAYDTASGIPLWDATSAHLPSTESEAQAVAVSPDGETVYVSGDGKTYPLNVPIVATVAYDASDGTRQWTARFDSRSQVNHQGEDSSEKLLVSEDGKRLYLSATFFGAPGISYGLLAYDTGETEPTPTPTASPSPSETGSPSPSPSESPQPGLSDVSFTEDSAASGQYSDETLFEARLTDSNGDPIEGQELTFELTGSESTRSFTATTNDDGVAAVTPTLEEKPGPHWLTVRFEGDAGHQGSVASADSRPRHAAIDRQVSNAVGVTSAIVHVRPEETLAEGLRLARAAGAGTGTTYGAIKVFVAYGPASTFRRLAKSPAIEYIEANRRLRYFTDTSHKATRGQDVLDGAIKLPDGTVIDGGGVGVAVVDSGIDGTHPDLVDRIGGNVKIICTTPQPVVLAVTGGFTECLGPKQAVPLQDTDTPSGGGHGTHVAGIVAGTGAASSGTYHGAAPGATLYGVSVGTALVVENALDGLAWVLENHDQVTPGIKVVNNSWGSGYSRYDPQNGPFHKATWKLQEALVDAGVSVVFAAGNASGNGSASTTSAECINPTPGILCVANYNDGGTGTRSGSISATSSRGKSDVPLEWPDISAPGTNIVSTCRVTLPICNTGEITSENNYRSKSGTSMAAPHVSGIIAQVYQADPTVTPAEVENLLEDSAHKFSSGSAYGLLADPTNPDSESSFEKGHGLVDVFAALNTILNEPEASPTPSSSPSATDTPSPTPTGTPPGDQHQGSTDTMSFVVDKEDSALELTETKGKNKALVAHLYDADTPADGIAGRTIDFYAGAELIGSTRTDDDGVASFEPPKEKGKKKAYEAVFEGDDFYVESSDSEGKDENGGGGGGNGNRDASAAYGGKVLLM